MKKVKFNFGILALVLGMAFAFATSAFTAAEVKARDTSWFEYDGEGEIDDPSSYVIMNETPDCDDLGELCSIQADVVSTDQPDITGSLVTEINNALSNPSSSHPNVRLFE